MITLEEKEEIIVNLVAHADISNVLWYEETLRMFWDEIIEGLKVGEVRHGFRGLEVRNQLQDRGWLGKLK